MHYDEILRKQQEIDDLHEKIHQLENIIDVLSSNGGSKESGKHIMTGKTSRKTKTDESSTSTIAATATKAATTLAKGKDKIVDDEQ